MTFPAILLDQLIVIATNIGPDDQGRFTVGKINTEFLKEGHSVDDWRSAIEEGKKSGKIEMHRSGSFFTLL